MNSPSIHQHRYPQQNEPAWSRSEKAIARKAFDAALERELQNAIREAKQKAGRIKEPADLWDLEYHLTQRRKGIDRKYDYRYSQLDLDFGRLLREKWVDEALPHAHDRRFAASPAITSPSYCCELGRLCVLNVMQGRHINWHWPGELRPIVI